MNCKQIPPKFKNGLEFYYERRKSKTNTLLSLQLLMKTSFNLYQLNQKRLIKLHLMFFQVAEERAKLLISESLGRKLVKMLVCQIRFFMILGEPLFATWYALEFLSELPL